MSVMEKQSYARRVLFPIAVVLGVMVASSYAYDRSRTIENHTLHLWTAHISALFMMLSIWMGALFANTIAYFRGASFKERLLVCLVVPVVWSIKTWSFFWGIYSPAEMVFLLFHHLILGCPIVGLLCMGISEIWCRAIHRRRTGNLSIRIFSRANVLVLLIGLGSTVGMLWNGGHDYYYLYMDVYTYLFF